MSKNRTGLKEEPNFDDKLWQYIEGNLSYEEAYDLELNTVDNPFWNDAVEGLAAGKDKEKIKELQQQLNQSIKTKTRKKRKAFGPNFIFPVMVAIFLVLLIVLIAFFLIRFFF
ncbi:MAG TPA: hypothetical protein PKX92_05775 [Edaphocola sp.]|nr:hypothetical protein [Edaphocola sp.]